VAWDTIRELRIPPSVNDGCFCETYSRSDDQRATTDEALRTTYHL
jgi:hypothetical protein